MRGSFSGWFLFFAVNRPEVNRRKEGESHEGEVFDNVLTFEGWGQRCLPSNMWQHDQRQGRHDHVRQEERDGHTLSLSKQEQETDEHFVQSKEDEECFEVKTRQEGRVVELLNQAQGRAGTDNF